MTGRKTLKPFQRVLAVGLGALGVLALLLWLVLAGPVFNDFRARIASDLLTESLGYPVRVEGRAQIIPGARSTVRVNSVSLESITMPGLDIAVLDHAEFAVETGLLLQGRLKADDILIDGLRFLFLRQDGVKSWQREGAALRASSGGERRDILAFFHDKSVELRNASLSINLEDTGFRFNFDVDRLNVEQSEVDGTTRVSGAGLLNGHETTLEGVYPDDAPFQTRALIGGTVIGFDGAAVPSRGAGAIDAVLSVEIDSAKEFLSTIGLQESFEGQASLSAQIQRLPGVMSAESVRGVVETADGQRIEATGHIEDLISRTGMDIFVTFETEHAAADFLPARRVRDFRLQSVSARLLGSLDEFVVEDLTARTNLFDPSIGQIGPARVDRFYRTSDGRLILKGVAVQAGPPNAPFVQAEGDILDLLAFQQVRLTGGFRFPATEFFSQMTRRQLNVLGGIKGEFELANSDGPLSLVWSKGQSFGTDAFDLNAELSIANIETLAAMDLVLDLTSSNSAGVLSEFGITSDLEGEVALALQLKGSGLEVDLEADAELGRSDFDLHFATTVSEERSSLNGAFHSATLDLSDLHALEDILEQIVSLSKGPFVDRVAKPLVIAPEVKPLVVQDAIKPLVLDASEQPSDILSIERILSDFYVDMETRVDRVSGLGGQPRIDGRLTIDQGLLKLEPLQLRVIGGAIAVTTEMDLVNAPETVKLSGQISNVGLPTLLKLADVDLDASGVFSGTFSVVGKLVPNRSFENTLQGRASLSLLDGSISTALLNLAGLGVVPWLFSSERREGQTDITCAAVPLEFRPGLVQTRGTVIETPRVRVEVKGNANWMQNSVNLLAMPRSIREGATRSPFPVSVTGQLDAPNVRINRQATSSGLHDGAAGYTGPCKPASSK